MIFSMTRRRSSSASRWGSCWVETTTVWTRRGLPAASYSTVTWLLPSGPQPVGLAGVPRLGQTPGQRVRQGDRQRHELRRLVGREAEHHALVAGAADVDAHGDVRRLRLDGAEHRQIVVVEAVVALGVADVAHRVADDLDEVQAGTGGDLAGDEHQTGGHQGLAGDPAVGVLAQHLVQDRVRDLVRHLVRMAFGDRLRGEQKGVSVAHVDVPGRRARGARGVSDCPIWIGLRARANPAALGGKPSTEAPQRGQRAAPPPRIERLSSTP